MNSLEKNGYSAGCWGVWRKLWKMLFLSFKNSLPLPVLSYIPNLLIEIQNSSTPTLGSKWNCSRYLPCGRATLVHPQLYYRTPDSQSVYYVVTKIIAIFFTVSLPDLNPTTAFWSPSISSLCCLYWSSRPCTIIPLPQPLALPGITQLKFQQYKTDMSKTRLMQQFSTH